MDRRWESEPKSLLDFSMDDLDLTSSGITETQKSLRKKFNGLKVITSTQASMHSNTGASGRQQSHYQNTTDSSLIGAMSSISSEDTFFGISRQRSSEDNDCTMDSGFVRAKRLKTSELNFTLNFDSHSDIDFDFSKLHEFKIPKNKENNGFNNLTRVCCKEERRQVELQRMRILIQRKNLELLQLQIEQVRIRMKNDETLLKKKLVILKMELELLQCSAAKY